jgi:UDP-N-acetylmuramoyl-tripeptide--D-alanyl-D-alanine ligase
MSVLWTAQDAAEATNGQAFGDWIATGVSIDSRSLQPGDLFVALTDQRDGHEFVGKALAKGAAAALVAYRPEGVAPDAPLLLVADVLAALESLAKAARARSSAKVVGVTGSVGKTSTKDMLRAALAGQGAVHAADKRLNNHWGVPLTLARMPAETDYAIIEIGMNHPGEITPLSRLARPDIALITTVAEAHMAAFANLSEIASAKAEIFEGLPPGGIAILNRDIETYAQLETVALAKQASIVTFGAHPDAQYQLTEAVFHKGVTSVRAMFNGQRQLFKIAAPGRHLAVNGLAVLAVVEALDADLAMATLDLGQWHPPAGRGQRHWIRLDPVEDSQCLELIDDAYNANPASMAAAFDVLASSQPVDGLGRHKRGRRIAFLSDMLELGPNAAEKHADLAQLAGVKSADVIHLAGPMMQHLHKALPMEKRGEWHPTAEDLAKRAHRLLDAGDVVMVKGSKGSRAALVVDAIRKLGQADEAE